MISCKDHINSLDWLGEFLEDLSYHDWLKKDFTNELLFNGHNTLVMLKGMYDLLPDDLKIPITDLEQKLSTGVGKSKSDLFNKNNWHDISIANKFIRNIQEYGNFSLDKWQDIGFGAANESKIKISFLAFLNKFSTDTFLDIIQKYNNRMSKHSLLGTVDKGKTYRDMILLFHPSLNEKLLGHGTTYYMGYIKAILDFKGLDNIGVDLLYSSMPMQNISNLLFSYANINYDEDDRYVYLNGRTVGEKIELEFEKVNGVTVYSKSFLRNSRMANAIIVLEDFDANGSRIFKKGQIYDAPYSRFRLSYKQSFSSKFFYFVKNLRLLWQDPDERESELKELEKKTFLLEEANKRLQNYSNNLEELVAKKTEENKRLILKLSEADKHKFANQLLAKARHELKNPLTYMKLALKNFEEGNVRDFDELLPSWNNLLDDLSDIYDAIDSITKADASLRINVESLFEQSFEYIKTLDELINGYYYQNKSVEAFKEGISTMSGVIDTLSQIAKLGTYACGTERIDLYDFTKDYLVKHKDELLKKGVNCKLTGKHVYVIGDKIQFYQVISNLINNSIDAMKDNAEKKLLLKIDKIKKVDVIYGRLKVIDNGIGISNDVKDDIYLPFRSTKDAMLCGLGLNIVKSIVVTNKGYIDYKSKRNIGTQFEVGFPLYEKMF